MVLSSSSAAATMTTTTSAATDVASLRSRSLQTKNDGDSSSQRTEQTCYSFENAVEENRYGDFCVDSLYIGNADADPFFCLAAFASHPDKPCSSCDYTYNACYNGFMKGYKLDCGNVYSELKHVSICGDSLYVDRGSNSGYHHHTTSYSSSSSSGNEVDAGNVVSIFFGCLVFMVAAFLRMNRLANSMSRRRDDARYNRVAAHQPQFQLTQVRARECLPGPPTFAFYNILSDEDYPNARKLIEANLKDDWQTIRDLFGNLRARMNAKYKNPAEIEESISSINLERSLCLSILQKEIEKSWPSNLEADQTCCPWLDKWCQTEPNNPDARWISVEAKISWAWHARSGRLARDVSSAQFDIFFTRLRQAQADLETAFDLFPPHDPVIYTGALTLVRGLQQPIQKLDAYLEKLQGTADPYFVPAHLTALQAQCKKWRGSHERMFAYVRRVTRDLPVGHPLWGLVPRALYERTLLMESIRERTDFRRRHPEFRRELIQAYEKALGGWEDALDPSMSVADRFCNLSMRNWFLSQLHLWGQTGLARKQARVIGKRPMEGCGHYRMETYKMVVKDLGFDVSKNVAATNADVPIVTATVV